MSLFTTHSVNLGLKRVYFIVARKRLWLHSRRGSDSREQVVRGQRRRLALYRLQRGKSHRDVRR